MSELTTCNYCTLQQRKRRAKKEGKKLTTRKSKEEDDMGGPGEWIVIEVDGEVVSYMKHISFNCMC
jgi:hypothetical protein